MPNTVTLTGFKEFQGKLKNLPALLKKEVDFAVEEAAQLWLEGADRDAPIDQGRLKQELSIKKIQSGEWDVVSPVEYSAYVEWGTRSKVRIPAELQAYAQQFRGATGRTGAKEMIFEWCRRKGIAEENWDNIYFIIMTKGINPHPFFFPQRQGVEAALLNDVKQIISAEY